MDHSKQQQNNSWLYEATLDGFARNDLVFHKEYLCSCSSCLRFKFKELFEGNAPLYFNDDDDNLLLASLFSVSPIEPIHLVQVSEKEIDSENHSDPYFKIISPGEKNLEEFYLDQEMLVERNNNFCPPK